MNTSSITRLANRTSLKLQKNAPKILFIAGIAGSVGAVVLSGRAAVKSIPVFDELADNRETLQNLAEGNEITPVQLKNEVRKQYVGAGVELTKLYAPVVIVSATSIACLTKSHNILSSRNTALSVALTGLHKTLTDYRGRARDDLGVEKELEYYHGTIEQTVDTVDSKGKVVGQETVKVLDPEGASPYSYYFSEKDRLYDADPGYNHNWMVNQEKWANLRLQTRGHIFLNEVLELLGLEPTPAGQVVGWLRDNSKTGGDGYVSFGFDRDGEFVAGYKQDVWLDFNVDGPIMEYI